MNGKWCVEPKTQASKGEWFIWTSELAERLPSFWGNSTHSSLALPTIYPEEIQVVSSWHLQWGARGEGGTLIQ